MITLIFQLNHRFFAFVQLNTLEVTAKIGHNLNWSILQSNWSFFSISYHFRYTHQ